MPVDPTPNRICLRPTLRGLLCGLCFWMCGAAPAWGQFAGDKITILREEDGAKLHISCHVLDHTGKYLRYRIREDGPITLHASSQVISIETRQTKQHVTALQKFAAGDMAESIRLFEEALGQEPREWVRRDILAMLVKAALHQNNLAQAGDRFLMIYGSDSSTQYFKFIPLAWTTAPPSESLKAAALRWMNRGTPVEKLLAASALLFDEKYKSSATVDLQQLRVHADTRIRDLAVAQLWRLELPGGQVDAVTLESWGRRIRTMSEDLRGGAYFLLGEGRRQRRQYDQAAVSYLWVPLVYDHDYHLSALASLQAADSLQAIGQTEEAITVAQDILRRYGQSSYAQDARQILESLRDAADANKPPGP